MKRFVLFLAIGILALGLVSGCDDVNSDSFGGVLGQVGQPAVGGCQVEVYDALSFEALDSTTGFITSGTTQANGRFAIRLPEAFLGRPLLVIARPGATALYRNFGAAGSPDIAWDASHAPWVAVVTEWTGGESNVTVNPITTLAFHSLMRLPAAEFGDGKLRFDRETVDATQAAVAASFGIAVNPIEGITPPQGSEFEPSSTFYLEDGNRNQSYAYVALQLAIAANDFATTSAPATDTALDFYDALFRDAEDSSIDGQYFGTPVPHLNLVPAVVGREATGGSSLFAWLATHALTPAQEGFLNAARGSPGFTPSPTEMLAAQAVATGTLRPTRIDSFDVQNYPYSGNVVMTIRGDGIRATDRFIFRSSDDSSAEFIVDRESVGVDGEFQFLSDTEIRMRIPDFATTTRTVPSALQVASGTNFRIVNMVLENQPEVTSSSRDVEHLVTSDARVTDRTEPLLVSARIGRVDAASSLTESTYGNNIYSAATDPAGLTPGVDDVYELRVRVCNPGPDAVNNTALDLGLSAFSQLGNPVVPDVFGGAAANRAVIFGGTLPSVSLNPGDVAELQYRFVFLDTAIPTDLAVGAPVRFTPVLSGVSAGAGTPTLTTSDVVGFNRTVELGPATPAQTAQLDALVSPTLPAAVTAGDSFEIQFDLSASPRSGGVMQTLEVTALDVTITFDGNTTTLHLTDAFFEAGGESDLYFTGLRLNSTGGSAMPVRLTQIANSDSVILTVRTDASRTGVFTVDFTATAIDVSTGTVTTQASGTSNVSIS
ncbi:MAG: hypothetical protein KDB68_13955 [Planctomycetes bacterium]|nr:hypothetical protein [Planctomycetota bacterium]